MHNKKIYLAGPMTGFPGYNFQRFYDIEEKLSSYGYQVVNPARIADDHGGIQTCISNQDIMNEVLRVQKDKIQKECYAIVLLDGWQRSKGTKEELKVALENNLEVLLIQDIYEENKNENNEQI